jgi:hypothetical protein
MDMPLPEPVDGILLFLAKFSIPSVYSDFSTMVVYLYTYTHVHCEIEDV